MDAIVGAAEARAAGLSSKAVRWRIETERWQDVHPRVYCRHTGPLLPEERCRAALLYAGTGAVLSHETAAALHGLRGAAAVPVHVTIPTRRYVRGQPGLVLHRSVATDGGYTTARRGLPVHRVERALLEWAGAAPDRAAAVLAAGVQERLTTPDRLLGCLLSLPRNHPGRARLRRLLDDVAGGTRSTLEARCVRLLRRAGLPEPARNHPLDLPGRRAWLDLCYPDDGVAIEVDGRSFHFWAEHWARDLARQNVLVLAGWRVLRFTGTELRSRPDRVVEQVRAALRRAA